MTTLDDLSAMTQLDPQNVLGSVHNFVDECATAWETSSQLLFPTEYSQVTNILVAGMGGSNFPAICAKDLIAGQLQIPMGIISDYHLPAFVNENTLVILSSYSGNTEEIISCANEALEKKAKVTAITSGGKIGELLKSHGLPGYFFDPSLNPSGQPRMGVGYTLFGLLGLFKALKFISLSDDDVKLALEFGRQYMAKNVAEVPTTENQAKQLATVLKNKFAFIVGAEFLKGFAKGFANQINESGKMIAEPHFLPELNHHLMEGLSYPTCLHQDGLFLFINSALYSDKIKRRAEITKQVVDKQQVSTRVVELTGPTPLSQVVEGFILSGFTTFYLAMLFDQNPASIPWVDFFKEQLAKD